MDDTTCLHLFLSGVTLSIGAWVLARMVRDRWTIDLLRLSIALYCGYVGGGTFVSFFYSGCSLPEVPVGPLLIAYGSFFLFALGAGAFRLLVPRPRTDYVAALCHAAAVRLPAGIWAYWCALWCVRIAMAVGFDLFFSGTFLGDVVLSVPTWLRAADALTNTFAFAVLFWAFSYQDRRKWSSAAGWLLVATEFLWIFARGRRWVLSTLVAFLIARVATTRRLTARTVALSAAGLAAAVFVMMPLFICTRYAFSTGTKAEGPLAGVVAGVQTAIENLSTSTTREEELEIHKQQMETRPLVLHWNWELADEPERERMCGQALLASVVNAVLTQSERLSSESAVEDHYGLPLTDIESNWPVFGWADFGLPGTFLYGALFCLVVRLFEQVIVVARRLSEVVGMLVLGSAFSAVALFDVEPSAILLSVRASVVLLLGCWACRALLGWFVRSSPRALRWPPLATRRQKGRGTTWATRRFAR
jgi:hypothetical protein